MVIRERDRVIGETRTPVVPKYERICFDKQNVRVDGKPMASLIHPGHPLMHSVIDLILEAHRNKLKQGAVLVNPNDDSTEAKVLFMLDHRIREGAGDSAKDISRRLQFIDVNAQGQTQHAGWAPHLDLQPINADDLKLVSDLLQASWITSNLEGLALAQASQKLAPEHLKEIKQRRERQIDKILGAVTERLVKEINYWSDRYIKLGEDVAAGKQPRLQPDNARRRVEELTARLEQRKKELENMRHVVSSTPVVVGGALVIPQGLLAQRKGESAFCVNAEARSRIEKIAMQTVMATEQRLGHLVFDVSAEKCGWDITARPPSQNGKLAEDRHIEVKGRRKGQTTITVSRNEIIYALNQQDKFLLAIVLVDESEHAEGPFYLRNPFQQEPEFSVASINYTLSELLSQAERL